MELLYIFSLWPSSKMCIFKYLIVFGSIVQSYCDWIQIAQNLDRYDKHTDHTIDSSLLSSEVGMKQNFSEIKYENLFDAIEHDFGDDFRTGNNAFQRKNEKNKRMFYDVSRKRYNTTVDARKSSTAYQYPNDRYVDPWAIYDRPITQKTITKISPLLEMNVTMVTTTESSTIITAPSSVFSSNVGGLMPQRNKTKILVNKTNVSINTNGTSTKPGKVTANRGQRKPANAHKLVPTEVVLKHVEFKPFDISAILNFFSTIQKSFSFGGIARVGDKVNFLEEFRDKLLTNIGKMLT